MARDAKIVPLAPARKCPICGRSATAAHRPFCSKRCADEDLGRWLTGKYAIRAVESEGEREADADDDQG